MGILISRCYSEVTPESAAEGEHSDSGFLGECEEVSFRELVGILKHHPVPSCYPPTGDYREWYASHSEVIDYATGTERECTVHFHHTNDPRTRRYWKLAAQAAGILRNPVSR